MCGRPAKIKCICELAHIIFAHNLYQYCILKLYKTSLDSFYKRQYIFSKMKHTSLLLLCCYFVIVIDFLWISNIMELT